jgi:hypothetical protein
MCLSTIHYFRRFGIKRVFHKGIVWLENLKSIREIPSIGFNSSVHIKSFYLHSFHTVITILSCDGGVGVEIDVAYEEHCC